MPGLTLARAQACPASVARMQRRSSAISSGALRRPRGGRRGDERRGKGPSGLVVDLQAGALRVDSGEQGQLSWSLCRRLAGVPGHDAPALDMGLFHRLRQAIVVDQLGMAIIADEEVAA